ncbi:FAD-binding oxidoreductase [Ilumatobacter nonamiensis]|uniref:FAD-binding oxidoreductase n=1 Tax=Ilumatobacter nonamiensis TaxID=467093 RepID=UPI000347F9D0|nr:FAD-binding oxidoreductase [Ilumatobacter nonamiensis]
MTSRTRRQLLRDASIAALGIGLAGPLAGCGDDTVSSTSTWWPTQSPGSAALDDLAKQISGGVLRPGDAGYGPTSLPANGRFRSIRPAAIARCNNAADVAAAVTWSADNGLAPTVRGGGHSYSGFSTSPDLILDVSSMNSVTVDMAAGTITTGGSALNGDILDFTTGGPVFLPGGTCRGVGVGGLALGGGIGYNAHWAGLTSDLMVASTIVTADGEVRTLSASEHDDLFWACRGGAGGNFGVNTQFTFALTDAPRDDISFYRFEWTGAERAAQVLATFDQMLVDAPAALNAVAMAEATSIDGGSPRDAISVMSRGQYIGPIEELGDLVAPLLAVDEPDSTTLKTLAFWDAQEGFASGASANHSWGDISRYAAQPIPASAVDELVDLLVECPHRSADANGSLWSLGWIGGDVIDKFDRTETAYVHRGMNTLWRPTTVWPNDANPSVGRDLNEWTAAMIGVLAPHTPPESYQNFPNRDIVDPLEEYYAENLDRLIDIKTDYDPTDLFTNPQGIPIRSG